MSEAPLISEEGKIANWRALIIDVSVRQGPGFLIAVLLLFGMYRMIEYAIHQGVPAHLSQIQKGYVDLELRYESQLKAVVDRHDTQVDRLTTAMEMQTKAFSDLATEWREDRKDRRAVGAN